MKRLIILFSVLVFSSLLTACGADEKLDEGSVTSVLPSASVSCGDTSCID